MMSLATIRDISAKAARKAARAHKVPLTVEQDDLNNTHFLWEHLRAMPFIGDYVPKGYKRVQVFFVDATGFGEPGEPALTQGEFLRKVRAGHAYAIIEAGQFQVYVGEYVTL